MTNNKLILYGAGKNGREYMACLRSLGYEDAVYGFCDKDAEHMKSVAGKPVFMRKDILTQEGLIYIITPEDEEIRKEIHMGLEETQYFDVGNAAAFLEVMPKVLHVNRSEFIREYCAYYHVDHMEHYFVAAESKASLDVFWTPESNFYQMFATMDLENVVELACGRGRHVPQYIESSRNVTLVDILQKNIDFCRKRFERYGNKVHFYKNDGFDLKLLASNSYTALFTYDAMVHFELMDIYSYLTDIYRILKTEGKALFHHSNYTADYKASFENAPGSRSFMSKNIFAYLAYRAGFKIISQRIIDWGGHKDLDCITLVQK